LRIVTKYLNEKFKEEFDPIYHLGIGMDALIRKYIISLGKYNLESNNYTDDDFLWICARHNKFEYVKHLVDKGADLHKYADRALRWASKNRNYDMAKYLLEKGANVHANHNGARSLARDNNDTNMIELLKKYEEQTPRTLENVLDEKFTEESDPIEDLGIGIAGKYKKWISKFDRTHKDWVVLEHPNEQLMAAVYDDESEFFEYIIKNQRANPSANNCEALRELAFKGDYKGGVKLVKLGADLQKAIQFCKDRSGWSSTLQGLQKIREMLKDNVNEKFTEEGDPIEDMGIGKDYYKRLLKSLYPTKIPMNRYYDLNKFFDYMFDQSDITLVDNTHFRIVCKEYSRDQFFQDLTEVLKRYGTNIKKVTRLLDYVLTIDLEEPINKQVNEKFQEDSDPIKDMGIGLKGRWKNLKRGDVVKVKKSLNQLHPSINKGDYLIILKVQEFPGTEWDKKPDVYRVHDKKDVKEKLENISQLSPTIDFWGWKWDFYKDFFQPVDRWELNEKFQEDSDPIKDMGIGLKGRWDNLKKGDVVRVKKYMSSGLPNEGDYLIITEIFQYPGKEWDKRAAVNVCKSMSEVKNNLKRIDNLFTMTSNWGWNWDFYKEFLEPIDVDVNEKFKEESDPIHDLGIGVEPLVHKWFLGFRVPEYQYKKFISVVGGKVNSSCGMSCVDRVKGQIPDFIQFGEMHGDFDISHSELTTLKGGPTEVTGSFYCQDNNLTSLKYAPKIVKGGFDCRNNAVQFTKQDVKKHCKVLGEIFV